MHVEPGSVRPGDVIEVEGPKVGSPRRLGEILEVLGQSPEVHFRVRWEDDHESIFYPSDDAHVRLGSRRKPAPGAR
jgi:Domain of unknown function (DUF1918)